MILLLLAFFFRDPVELVALGAVCKSCCVATLFAGCFMEMSVAAEGGRRLTLRYIVHSLDIWTYAMAAISWFFLGRNVFFQDPFVVIRSEMEPIRIFSTRPVNFKIVAG